MYIYFFAGVFLLLAIIFVIKYLFDSRRANATKDIVDSNGKGVTIITEEEDKKHKKAKKRNPKRDVILALLFMALCEVCVLLGNYVIKI